jgi:hypothetical protein
MSGRRGLALVMTLLASATVMTSAAAATAAAKPTICVALVVDGRAIGSDVSTTCAKVSKGATGVDVLQAGGHTVGFRSDGLLCTIDGLPKGGCATVDDSHYWAYFHRSPGATRWVYSNEGASTYQPVNDSTDGWVYDNGKARTPENIRYAQICKHEVPSTPAPTPTTPRPTHTSSAAASPTRPPHPASTTHPPSPTPTATTSHRRHHATSTAPTQSAVVVSPAPSVSPTNAALAGAVTPPPSHHGWLGLLIGVVVVGGLGAAAAVRFRRSAR